MGGLRILLAASEAYPLAKTGGLGDYVAALGKALTRAGADVRVLLPGYPHAVEALSGRTSTFALDGFPGFGGASLIQGRIPGSDLRAWLLDCPGLFERPGGLYLDPDGAPWPDNARRFAMLARAVRLLAMGEGPVHWQPDVVHLNDWQTGPAAALLAREQGPRPATVFTIHNLAFHGLFDPGALEMLGLPADLFTPDALEFWGQVSFLKAGLRFADRLTTVSATYAREIRTPAFGCGLDGVLCARPDGVLGVRNGIDADEWNPATDPHLPATYDVHDLRGKAACKQALQQRFGLEPDPARPLLGYLCRLTGQKMADVVLEALPALDARGMQVAVMGQGDPAVEAAFRAAAAALPGRVGVTCGYDEATAHLLLAGCDVLLAPARFEPCGLTQMYAMRYGAVPVASRIGGLAETIDDLPPGAAGIADATGFLFDGTTAADLLAAVDRAAAWIWQRFNWRRLMTNGMRRDFSWEQPVQRYLALYEELAAGRPRAALPRMPAPRAPGRVLPLPVRAPGLARHHGRTIHGIEGSIAMPNQPITAEDIRRRAYELWEKNGRAHGRHLEHWLQAERELEAEQAAMAAGPATAAPQAPRRSRTAKPKDGDDIVPGGAGAVRRKPAPARGTQRTA